jgi:hypothetical protein
MACRTHNHRKKPALVPAGRYKFSRGIDQALLYLVISNSSQLTYLGGIPPQRQCGNVVRHLTDTL